MPVLAILTCQVLEDEIAHIILGDSEIKRISVIQSAYSQDLYQKIESSKDVEAVSLLDISHFKQAPVEFELIVQVMEVGLHINKERLQNGVFDKIKEMEPYCDAILLGYGLCGNAFETLDEYVNHVSVPVIMPVNKDGSKVDDCICMIIGGSPNYLEEVKNVAGTWFITPGWLKHWETLLLHELGAKDIKTAKWIFDKAGYSRALIVNSHTFDEEKLYAESQAFAKKFDFYTEEREGTLEIIEKAYSQAKNKARD